MLSFKKIILDLKRFNFSETNYFQANLSSEKHFKDCVVSKCIKFILRKITAIKACMFITVKGGLRNLLNTKHKYADKSI